MKSAEGRAFLIRAICKAIEKEADNIAVAQQNTTSIEVRFRLEAGCVPTYEVTTESAMYVGD